MDRKLDLTHYWDREHIFKNKNKIKKVFFFRICGTGMGASACLLKERGFEVEGADVKFYPPMGDYLKSTGIKLYDLENFDFDKLKEFDLVIVGNVVPRGSQEASAIEECGTPFASFPSALGGLLLNDLNVVGIAGTHGKTTTTFLITQVFENLGKNPGYFIGGVMEGRPSSTLGDGSYFFIESDEYDCAYFEKVSKFRNYTLDHMFLTSLEFDHGDIYDSIEDIKREFLDAIPAIQGQKIFSKDFEAIDDLVRDTSLQNDPNFCFYGESENSRPKIISMKKSGTEFEIEFKNETLVFQTNLIGRHNILNLTACLIFALNEGFSPGDLNSAIKNLKLVKRRQELRGSYKGAYVLDDFAHHPRAVALTVEGVRISYPDKKIVVILEPASATARSSLFQKEWPESLKTADSVILVKPKPTTILALGDLNCDKVISDLADNNVEATLVDSLDQLKETIDSLAKDDVLLLVLSNSTCMGLWESDFANFLENIASD